MQRVKELDSLRGLSALVIVFYHLFWIPIGLMGSVIDLFFVLSGYLITSILLSHPPSGKFLFAFYVRRGLRIWPIYYLSLFFLLVINPWTATPSDLRGLANYLTFTQCVPHYWFDTEPVFMPAFRHTWSLAVEEQFYFLWPALLWLLGGSRLKYPAFGLMVLAFVTRTLGFTCWILATNCDGLALGCLLAILLRDRTTAEDRKEQTIQYQRVGLGSAAVCIGCMVVLQIVPASSVDIARAILAIRGLAVNLVYFAVVALAVLNTGHPLMSVLRDRRLVYLGQISYGLYLYHNIIFILWEDYAARHGLGTSVVHDLAKVTVSLGVAALSYRFVERPFLALKDRFPYPTAGTRSVAHPRGWLPAAGTEAG